MRKERITLTDSLHEAIMKLAEGNPGALTVCARLYQEGAAIDPDAFGGGLANLLSLDTLGIYGPSIWLLYKYICGHDITKVTAVLRGQQLGFVDRQTIDSAISWCTSGRYDGTEQPLNAAALDDILAKVQERLPRFGQQGEGE